MSNEKTPNGAAAHPTKTLNPHEVQQLLGEMLLELNDVGEAIVMKKAQEKGVDVAGVGWLLSQACLSVAVASYFHAGQPLDTLLEQIRQAWRQHQIISQQTIHQGRA